MESRRFLVRNLEGAKKLCHLLTELSYDDNEIIYEVSIQRSREPRTSGQNSLYRLLVRRIADLTGHSFQETEELFSEMFLEDRMFLVKGEELWLKPDANDLNTKEMSDFIDQIQAFASTSFGCDIRANPPTNPP